VGADGLQKPNEQPGEGFGDDEIGVGVGIGEGPRLGGGDEQSGDPGTWHEGVGSGLGFGVGFFGLWCFL
jgi:hypothetical protein